MKKATSMGGLWFWYLHTLAVAFFEMQSVNCMTSFEQSATNQGLCVVAMAGLAQQAEVAAYLGQMVRAFSGCVRARSTLQPNRRRMLRALGVMPTASAQSVTFCVVPLCVSSTQ